MIAIATAYSTVNLLLCRSKQVRVFKQAYTARGWGCYETSNKLYVAVINKEFTIKKRELSNFHNSLYKYTM